MDEDGIIYYGDSDSPIISLVELDRTAYSFQVSLSLLPHNLALCEYVCMFYTYVCLMFMSHSLDG